MIAAVPNTKVDLGTLCGSRTLVSSLNRVNMGNIKHVVSELFENLIRGCRLFTRSVMKAQAAPLPFTPVFAALVSIINTKIPITGEFLLHQFTSQCRREFSRNNKVCWTIVDFISCKLIPPFQTVHHSTTTFIAHLVNQGVAHELIALQIPHPPP